MNKVDVTIIGGGMVGLALANAMLASRLKIAVVESTLPELSWPTDSSTLRVSAINRASERFLRRLGVWSAMQGPGVSAFSAMQVWDANSMGAIHLTAAEVGEAELGFIAENRVLQKALWQSLVGVEHCQLICPVQCQNLSRTPEGWQLQLSNGQSLHTKLLIGADGARSWVREQVGICTSPVHYGQNAIVANINTELPHQSTAWQRFLHTGPLALLPLANQQQCSIVWTLPEADAKAYCELPQAEFNALLTEAFEQRLGKLSVFGKPQYFPLSHHHADTYVLPQVALIGDAAHSIHPLAGQGVNLGFADAACLAEILQQAIDKRRPFYSLANLQAYERERRIHNSLMQQAMTGFNALFSNSNPALSNIRGLGLKLTDKLLPIKRFYIKKAMGLS